MMCGGDKLKMSIVTWEIRQVRVDWFKGRWKVLRSKYLSKWRALR